MKKLSPFDLIMIVVFVVVGLLGGGAWWYFSGMLGDAKTNVGAAAQDFEKYSSKEIYLPTPSNEKILHSNIDLTSGLLDPLVKTKLQSPDNKIFSVVKQDPVAWKHDLDDRVSRLNDEAKVHGITVPAHFYYSFSRYLSTNPGEDKTVVLTKQLLGIEQIVTILINAPIKGIQTIRRTDDEDESSGGGANSSRTGMDKDYLPGRTINIDGGVYTDYPFELEIDATTDSLRKVIDDLVRSPYVFVIRSVSVKNSKAASPQLNDLDRIAAQDQQSAVADSSPGAVAASAKTARPPQFLFGSEILHVRFRIDMIEWKHMADAETQAAPSPGRTRNRAGAPGNNNRPPSPGSD